MMTDQHSEVLRLTYSTLRWLLVLLPLVLFVVTTGAAIVQGHLEPTISAYYGGPVRDVFVGVLIAVAACLVAYQGATALEDYNLGGAAFYAVIVALVPTGLEEILTDVQGGRTLAPRGYTPAEYIWSLRLTLTVVLVLCLWLFAREMRRTERMRRLLTGDRWSLAFVAVTGGVLLAFLALTMWQLWVPPVDQVTMGGISLGGVQVTVHDIAAIFLLCALAVAVWSHAWPQVAARRARQPLSPEVTDRLLGYRVIFVLMLLGPAVAWAVSETFAPGHLVIILEWWEIALFGLFWALETWRLRRPPRR